MFMRLPARIAVFTVYMIALRSTPLLPIGRLLSVSDKISALRRIRFQFFYQNHSLRAFDFAYLTASQG